MMTKMLPVIFVIFAVLCILISTRNLPPAHTEPVETSRPGFSGAEGVDARIKRVENGLSRPVVFRGHPLTKASLADRMQVYKVPGVSIAVINGGEVEWARGHGAKEAGGGGRVKTDTLFQAASVSKVVAAVGALRLVEQGKLKLDENVNDKLRSWKVPENEFTEEKKVTLRGLLSHGAGVTVHGFAGHSIKSAAPTALQVLEGVPPANSPPVRVDVIPGTLWRYSGGGYTVVQQLLTDVEGKAFPDLMKAELLGRLGMRHSTFEQPLPQRLRASAASGHTGSGEPVEGGWHVYPTMAAGGLWSTPSDLALFAIEVQRAYKGESGKLLSARMTRQMLTPQIENWGLGPTVQGVGSRLRFSHGGSNLGFRAYLVAYAETGQGAVVMTNSENGENLIDEILRSIATEYNWPDYQPTEKVLANVNPKVYQSYVGQYEFAPNFLLTVTAENNHLYAQLPVNPREEMYPESETKFFLMVPGVPEVTFVKNERGDVTGINLLIEGRNRTLRKLP